MSDWSKPQEISQAQFVFPAGVKNLMPTMAEIPEEFKRSRTPWNRLASKWFFSGISAEEAPLVFDGVEEVEKKFRHLKTILGSFEPKHEHKEAAVAYLMSLWLKPDWAALGMEGPRD